MPDVSPKSTRSRRSIAPAIAPFVAGAAMLVLALLLGSGRPSPAVPAPATLQIFTRLIPSGMAFTEGAADYVVVEREGGQVVLNEEYLVLGLADPPLTCDLPAGVYVLTHYQRPCNLSCDRLGPRVDECRRLIELAPGAAVEATVSIKVGNPCSIDLLPAG